MNKRLKVTRKRRFSAHHMLIGAARLAVEDAESRRPGWAYDELTAVTLSGLAIEALCNAVGEAILKDWGDFEGCSPNAKLRLLCEHLKVPYDKTKEPWSSARWLIGLRNKIAHAKPQIVEEEHNWTRQEYDKRRTEEPKSALEREITLGNAKRALKSAEDILLKLCEVIPDEYSFGLYSDGWEGSASVIDDD